VVVVVVWEMGVGRGGHGVVREGVWGVGGRNLD